MKVTIDLTFSDENIIDIVDTAGYGINHWALRATLDTDNQTYTVTDDEENTSTLSFDDIRNAIQKIINREVQVSDFIYKLMTNDIDEGTPDIGNYDSDVCDSIIQVAVFNEVIYG